MREEKYITEYLKTMDKSFKEDKEHNGIILNDIIKRSAINGDYSTNVNDFKYDDNKNKKD